MLQPIMKLLRLIVHGILHLIGYDDVTLAKRKRMKIVEDTLGSQTSKNTLKV